MNVPATTASTAAAAPPIQIQFGRRFAGAAAGVTAADTAGTLCDSLARFRRLRSLRRSAAVWYRTSRSFSRALATIRSNSGGIEGVTLDGGGGFFVSSSSKIAIGLLPGNG